MGCVSAFRRCLKNGIILSGSRTYCDMRLNLKRVLILNKRTRYEMEKTLRPDVNDNILEKIIRKKGSDYEKLLKHHNSHKMILDNILQHLKNFNVEIEVVNRTSYGEKEVDWADLIIVGGGDGTFLLGASKIRSQNKPIVGFNTDPERSEGHLCLPKKYTYNIPVAINRIMKREYNWLLRNRIEIKVTGTQAMDDVVIIDATKIKSLPDCASQKSANLDVKERVLPSLALNEVFMGETISSQVSHLLVKPDQMQPTAVKCSGLCVSTGTGSTSWHLSINRLTEEKVRRILLLSGQKVDVKDLKTVMDLYNLSLRFPPDERVLHWSLREPIYGRVFPDPPNFPAGGFADEVSVTSRCFSGFLVVDGTHCYPFHDGSKAHLYSSPDKRLRTIHFD